MVSRTRLENERGPKRPLLVRHQYHPLLPSKCKGILHKTLRRSKLLVRVQVRVFYVPVFQMDRNHDYESWSCRFDSCQERFRASGGTVYAGEASLSAVEVGKIIYADDEKRYLLLVRIQPCSFCSCNSIEQKFCLLSRKLGV